MVERFDQVRVLVPNLAAEFTSVLRREDAQAFAPLGSRQFNAQIRAFWLDLTFPWRMSNLRRHKSSPKTVKSDLGNVLQRKPREGVPKIIAPIGCMISAARL